MGEFIFSIGVFVTKIHPARLIIFEVRAARNFEICPALAGARRPNFNVVSLRRSKSEIPGAELQHAVLQTEELPHRFRVRRIEPRAESPACKPRIFLEDRQPPGFLRDGGSSPALRQSARETSLRFRSYTCPLRISGAGSCQSCNRVAPKTAG